MNDRQLRYILEIAREKKMTAAAKNLYISQPSLSNLLDHVENELGIKLFERRTGSMQLTAAGEYYVAAAKKILGIEAQLERELAEIRSEERGKLTIGCSRKKSSVIFPFILPQLREKYPLYSFSLVEDSMESLAQKLSTGVIDVAFLYKEYKINHTKTFTCAHEEVCILAPTDFHSDRIALQNGGISVLTDLTVLQDKEFVLFKRGLSLRTLADEIFRKNGIAPKILLETDSWQACLAMVEHCGAFTLLPYSPIESKIAVGDRGENLPFQPLIPVQNYHRILRAYYREDLEGTKILRDFLDICDTMDPVVVHFGD